MDTTPEAPTPRRGRRSAQVLACAALACAVVAFFWDVGLASFLTPDGWLIADAEEESR